MLDTISAAIATIVFLVPGYVWRSVEGQFVYLDKRLEWQKFALGLLARSSAVYALFVPLIYRAWNDDWITKRPVLFVIASIGLVVLLPSISGLASGIVRQRDIFPWLFRKSGLQTFEAHHIPTAWDYVFSNLTAHFAVVTLKNGQRLYGYIGPESYFSSDPDVRDLFVSRLLRPTEDGKMEWVPGTAGVYVNKDEASIIEFIAEAQSNV